MPESGSVRTGKHANPPVPSKSQPTPSRKLQARQKRLLTIAASVVVLIGVGFAIYSYISGAPQRAEDQFNDGMKFMQPGLYQKSIPLFTRSIEIHETARACLERGNAHRFLGEIDPAI